MNRIVALLLIPSLVFSADLRGGIPSSSHFSMSSMMVETQAISPASWSARPVRAYAVGSRSAHQAQEAEFKRAETWQALIDSLRWGLEELIFRDLTHATLGHTWPAYLISVGLFTLLHHNFREDPWWMLIPRAALSWSFESASSLRLFGISGNYMYHYGWNTFAISVNNRTPNHWPKLPVMSLSPRKPRVGVLTRELDAWKEKASLAFGGKAPVDLGSLDLDLHRAHRPQLLQRISQIAMIIRRELHDHPTHFSFEESTSLRRLDLEIRAGEFKILIEKSPRLYTPAGKMSGVQSNLWDWGDHLAQTAEELKTLDRVSAANQQLATARNRFSRISDWLLRLEEAERVDSSIHHEDRDLVSKAAGHIREKIFQIDLETLRHKGWERAESDINRQMAKLERMIDRRAIGRQALEDHWEILSYTRREIQRLSPNPNSQIRKELESRLDQIISRIENGGPKEDPRGWGWGKDLERVQAAIWAGEWKPPVVRPSPELPGSRPAHLSQPVLQTSNSTPLVPEIPTLKAPVNVDLQLAETLLRETHDIGLYSMDYAFQNYFFSVLESGSSLDWPAHFEAARTNLADHKAHNHMSWKLSEVWNQLHEWWRIPGERRRELLKELRASHVFEETTFENFETLATVWRQHIEHVRPPFEWWATLLFLDAMELAGTDESILGGLLEDARVAIRQEIAALDKLQIPIPKQDDVLSAALAQATHIRTLFKGETLDLGELTPEDVTEREQDIALHEQRRIETIQSQLRRAENIFDAKKAALRKRAEELKDPGLVALIDDHALEQGLLSPVERLIELKERLLKAKQQHLTKAADQARDERAKGVKKAHEHWRQAQADTVRAMLQEAGSQALFGPGLPEAIARMPAGAVIVDGAAGLAALLPMLNAAPQISEIYVMDALSSAELEDMIPAANRQGKPIHGLQEDMALVGAPTVEEMHTIIHEELEKAHGDRQAAMNPILMRISQLDPTAASASSLLRHLKAKLVIASDLSPSGHPEFIRSVVRRFVALEMFPALNREDLPFAMAEPTTSEVGQQFRTAMMGWDGQAEENRIRILSHLGDADAVFHLTRNRGTLNPFMTWAPNLVLRMVKILSGEKWNSGLTDLSVLTKTKRYLSGWGISIAIQDLPLGIDKVRRADTVLATMEVGQKLTALQSFILSRTPEKVEPTIQPAVLPRRPLIARQWYRWTVLSGIALMIAGLSVLLTFILFPRKIIDLPDQHIVIASPIHVQPLDTQVIVFAPAVEKELNRLNMQLLNDASHPFLHYVSMDTIRAAFGNPALVAEPEGNRLLGDLNVEITENKNPDPPSVAGFFISSRRLLLNGERVGPLASRIESLEQEAKGATDRARWAKQRAEDLRAIFEAIVLEQLVRYQISQEQRGRFIMVYTLTLAALEEKGRPGYDAAMIKSNLLPRCSSALVDTYVEGVMDRTFYLNLRKLSTPVLRDIFTDEQATLPGWQSAEKELVYFSLPSLTEEEIRIGLFDRLFPLKALPPNTPFKSFLPMVDFGRLFHVTPGDPTRNTQKLGRLLSNPNYLGKESGELSSFTIAVSQRKMPAPSVRYTTSNPELIMDNATVNLTQALTPELDLILRQIHDPYNAFSRHPFAAEIQSQLQTNGLRLVSKDYRYLSDISPLADSGSELPKFGIVLNVAAAAEIAQKAQQADAEALRQEKDPKRAAMALERAGKYRALLRGILAFGAGTAMEIKSHGEFYKQFLDGLATRSFNSVIQASQASEKDLHMFLSVQAQSRAHAWEVVWTSWMNEGLSPWQIEELTKGDSAALQEFARGWDPYVAVQTPGHLDPHLLKVGIVLQRAGNLSQNSIVDITEMFRWSTVRSLSLEAAAGKARIRNSYYEPVGDPKNFLPWLDVPVTLSDLKEKDRVANEPAGPLALRKSA